MYLTIAQAKKHLNIEDDPTFTEEDAYISDLIDVSESVVENHIHQKLIDLAAANDGILYPSIIHACLLMLGNFYVNREIVSFSTKTLSIPFNYQYLLDPYINYLN